MVEKRPLDDTELDALFQEAGANPVAPSDDLMTRIMADAADNTPTPAAPAPRTGKKPGVASLILSALGGWKPVAGLVAATIVGLMIGYVTPETLDTVATGTFLSAQTGIDGFLPSINDLLSEG